jgi:hypothetical protein
MAARALVEKVEEYYSTGNNLRKPKVHGSDTPESKQARADEIHNCLTELFEGDAYEKLIERVLACV